MTNQYYERVYDDISVLNALHSFELESAMFIWAFNGLQFIVSRCCDLAVCTILQQLLQQQHFCFILFSRFGWSSMWTLEFETQTVSVCMHDICVACGGPIVELYSCAVLVDIDWQLCVCCCYEFLQMFTRELAITTEWFLLIKCLWNFLFFSGLRLFSLFIWAEWCHINMIIHSILLPKKREFLWFGLFQHW